MGDLSRHFSRYEMQCPDGCGFNTVDYELMDVLELVRCAFNKPLDPTPVCRCERCNDNTSGASKTSKHLWGQASDISIKGVSPKAVYEFLDNMFPDKYGIGLYDTWVHFDIRSGKARW